MFQPWGPSSAVTLCNSWRRPPKAPEPEMFCSWFLCHENCSSIPPLEVSTDDCWWMTGCFYIHHKLNPLSWRCSSLRWPVHTWHLSLSTLNYDKHPLTQTNIHVRTCTNTQVLYCRSSMGKSSTHNQTQQYHSNIAVAAEDLLAGKQLQFCMPVEHRHTSTHALCVGRKGCHIS